MKEKEKAKPKARIRNVLRENKYVENLFVLYNNITPNINSKKPISPKDIIKESIIEDVIISDAKSIDNEKLTPEQNKISTPVKSLNNDISTLEELSNQKQIDSTTEMSTSYSENSSHLPNETLTHLGPKIEIKDLLDTIGESII